MGNGQIAAIALDQNMKVATRDTDDFVPTGVALIDSWSIGQPVPRWGISSQ